MAGDSPQLRGLMVYPSRGLRKAFFRLPLLLWRLGFGPLLRRHFLVLTTTGRKTGTPRHTMLEYSVTDGRKYVTSGWSERPQWWKNAAADPRVTIQARDGTEVAVASRVENDSELARLYSSARGKSPVWKEWLESLGIHDDLEDFIAKKDRLCVLRLDPCGGPMPPPLRTNLVWVWPALVLALWLIYTLAG